MAEHHPSAGVTGFAEVVLAARAAERGRSGPPVTAGADHAAGAPPSLTSAAPGLAQLGLQLAAVRELRHGGRTFTEYVYRNARDARLALYEAGPRPGSADDVSDGQLRIVEGAGTHVAEWSVGRRRYVLVADRPPAGLLELARRVRASMPGAALAGSPAHPPVAPAGSVPELAPPSGGVTPAPADPAVAGPPSARDME